MSHSRAAPRQFNWSNVSSGKIYNGLRSSQNDLTKKLSDSSNSSDTDSDCWSLQGSRQQELLSSAKRISNSGRNSSRQSKELSSSGGQAVFEGRQWLKSARQRELIRTGSGSNLVELRQEHNRSALRRQWPSTAKQRLCPAPLPPSVGAPRAHFSAGTLDHSLKEPSRDSAGSLGRSGSGADLLVEAVRYGRTRHIKLLLDGGTDPDVLDSEGVTALIAAVADSDDPSVQERLLHILLDAGADPNVGDCEGTTPLMHAASTNYHDAAVILLQNEKTDCGLQDKEGFSALMYASASGFANIVLLILAAFKKVHHVTNLGQRNNRGLSACELAEQNDHWDVAALLKTDSRSGPFSNSQGGRLFFKTQTHELSRSPTPSDETSSSVSFSHFHSANDPTLRPPTPVSDLESLSSFDQPANQEQDYLLNTVQSANQEYDHLLNSLEDCSVIDSGNEADTESLMDGDVSPSEDTEPSMTSPVVGAAHNSVGNGRNPSPSMKQPLKIFVDRNTIDQIRNKASTSKSGGTQVLNPLKKVSTGPFDAMPKIDLASSNRSLNRSIKNLVQEEHESRPSNRPPTPARPSLPNLMPGGVLSIHDVSSTSSDGGASTSGESRGRKMTVEALFSRSTSDPKSPPRDDEEEEVSTDIFDASTKSEGWDALWGPRGKALLSSGEGHVVPLPPIGQSKSVSKRERKLAGDPNLLKVAKKTLERLDNALAPTKNRKSKSLPRSRTIDNLNLSS